MAARCDRADRNDLRPRLYAHAIRPGRGHAHARRGDGVQERQTCLRWPRLLTACEFLEAGPESGLTLPAYRRMHRARYRATPRAQHSQIARHKATRCQQPTRCTSEPLATSTSEQIA